LFIKALIRGVKMGWLDVIKSLTDAMGNTAEPVAVRAIQTNTYTYHIADLAEKYETSNRGPGYISNGSKWGDPGGDSYGSYQIETAKGTMADYLKQTNDQFTQALKPYAINSAQFKQTWIDLATNFPTDFQQSQFDFLCKKKGGYNDAISYAQRLGWLVSSFALQSAVFSTSNQSGGWRKILDSANITTNDSINIQINKLYDARARYFLNLNLSIAIKTSIMQQRCGKNLDMFDYVGSNERKDCLKLI
jgi:hypothetical protein